MEASQYYLRVQSHTCVSKSNKSIHEAITGLEDLEVYTRKVWCVRKSMSVGKKEVVVYSVLISDIMTQKQGLTEENAKLKYFLYGYRE